jgi:plastocyanin
MQHAARTTFASLAFGAAMTLGACGGIGPTPVPPATPAPPATAGQSATAGQAASAGPSASLVPLPSAVDPTPVGGVPEAPGFEITANQITFEPTIVTVPANVALVLQFTNKDAGVPHGFQITDGKGNSLFQSQIVAGPNQARLQLPALGPGTYTFTCPVHPNMTGTITAQ